MYEVYAYDKDDDYEVLLVEMDTYEAALIAAKIYVPLVNGQVIRRNICGCISQEGQPFDWVFIRNPDGTQKTITD